MLTGPHVILTLKVAVATVTVLLLLSLIALYRGNTWLHGRINIAFFILTMTALIGLELIVRLINPEIFSYLNEGSLRTALMIHLSFSLPAAALLPAMLFTGLTHRRRIHLVLATVFSVLWIGTFVTGIFFLPHTIP